MTTRKTKTVPTYICDNSRFYCLAKYSRVPLVCTCGGKLYQIGTQEGAKLKVMRAGKRNALSGSIRNKFAGVKASRLNKDGEESHEAVRL